MKYFIFCLFISLCNAQNGSVIYSGVLNFNDSKVRKINNVMYFNNFESIFYSLPININGSKNKTAEIKDQDNVQTIDVKLSDSIGNLYYRDLKSNDFICREASLVNNFKSKYYIYEDQGAQHLSWDLKDDYKTISGYNSQKATVDFRGRTYEAWFTTEIPFPYGPWKLGGLPGLILEVYDLSKEVSFTAEKITIPDSITTDKILKPIIGTKITHKEFVVSKDNEDGKISKAILSKLPKGSKIYSSKAKKNTLELEYEWSKE